MAERTWGELYKGAERQSVPGGAYAVQVKAACPYAQSSLLFLDLEVLAGPEQGNVGQVNLFVPDPGAKGSFYFQKKISGALEGPPPGFVEALDIGDKERALNILATALKGRTFYADLSVRTDGDYAGSNELESTKPMDAPAAPPVQAAPAPAAVPAQNGHQPGAVQTAPAPAVVPVAAAPAPVAPPAPVVAPAPVDPNDVPF